MVDSRYLKLSEEIQIIIILYLMFQLFPVLGFGARLPPDGRVSHCFYVNGHDSNPYCQGITGRTFSVGNLVLKIAIQFIS